MIKNEIEALFPQLVEWRRWFHQYPELSFQEKKTAETIAQFLEDIGLDVKTGVGGMGVTGLLKGDQSGPTIALRADIDALPIQDEKTTDYASKVPGVMHACGHDGHTTMLMGAAKLLAKLRNQLTGNILFLFQHAEELPPGGAQAMIEAGVLDGIDRVYGAHLWSPLPVGTIGIREGKFMAAADMFEIEIIGKGGHGAIPHEAIDAVMIASHAVVNLQTVISRQMDPLEEGVITVGSIHGGEAFNVIAENCRLKGTVRSFDPEVRQYLAHRVEEVVKLTCDMFGAAYQINYQFGYPALLNDKTEACRIRKVSEAVVGEENVITPPPVMGGEDFARYLEHRPGAFFFVGAGNDKKGITAPHHHPLFDFDEQAMKIGVEILTKTAIQSLQSYSMNDSSNVG